MLFADYTFFILCFYAVKCQKLAYRSKTNARVSVALRVTRKCYRSKTVDQIMNPQEG